MNKAQKRAMYDFAQNNGYFGVYDIYMALKELGVIARNERFEDVASYPKNPTYDAMYEFLEESLG